MPESGLRIALVSHDTKKPALVDLASSWREALSRHRVCGTGTTVGEVIQARADLQVGILLSGPNDDDPRWARALRYGTPKCSGSSWTLDRRTCTRTMCKC